MCVNDVKIKIIYQMLFLFIIIFFYLRIKMIAGHSTRIIHTF